MCYLPTVKVTHPQRLIGLRPGQWIDYNGAKGRFMGRTGSTVWIAWGGTARKRFHIFAKAFKTEMARRASIFRLDLSKDIGDGGIHRIL